MKIYKICKKQGELTLEQVWQDTKYYRCKECTALKNAQAYQKHKEKRLLYAINYGKENRDKKNAWARNDRLINKEKYKEAFKKGYKQRPYNKRFGEILKKRGITFEQYNEMLAVQDNKCAICLKIETCKDPRNDYVRRLSIDHCHITNKTRGLLCSNCNSGMGKLGDSIEHLQAAINYLKRY